MTTGWTVKVLVTGTKNLREKPTQTERLAFGPMRNGRCEHAVVTVVGPLALQETLHSTCNFAKCRATSRACLSILLAMLSKNIATTSATLSACQHHLMDILNFCGVPLDTC